MTVSSIHDCNGQWSCIGCGSILYLIKLELFKSAFVYLYFFTNKSSVLVINSRTGYSFEILNMKILNYKKYVVS